MLVNGIEVNENNSYRIENRCEGSNGCFWYSFNSISRELNSNFKTKETAEIYSGKKIIKNADLIREYKSAKLIQV